MKDQKKNNKGFSLVELIVVVAIMAVLLGVLVPTLVRNVEKSKKQKDISNLSELRSAIQTTMASEEFSGLTGTLSIKAASSSANGFTITNTGTTPAAATPDPFGGDATLTGKFWTEVLANINGGAQYKFEFTSKLKDSDTTLNFVFQNEKVVGSLTVTGCSKSEYNGTIQLQDAAQSSTAP